MSCDWSLQNDAAAHWKNLWRNKLHTVREHLLNYSLWCSVNLQGSNLPDLRMTKVSIYHWKHRSPTIIEARADMDETMSTCLYLKKKADILEIINLTCCLPYGLSARPLRWPSAAQFFKDLHRMAGLPLFPSENLWTTKLQPLDWPVHLPTNSVNMVQVSSSIEHATSCNNLFDQHGKVRIHQTTLCCLKPSEWSETRWQNPIRREFPKYWGRKKLPTNSRDLWSTSVVVPIECHPCKEQPQPDRRHSRTTCQKSSATRQRNASQGQNAAKSIGSVSWHSCGIYGIICNIL